MKTQLQMARRHLDERFASMVALDLLVRPPKGWVRAIRESLGLTLAQLGHRIGVSKQRAMALERQEIQDSVTLATMRRAAEALDCRFVYAIVPNGKQNNGLQGMVETQAKRKADAIIKQAGHSMGLEDQATSVREYEAQRNQLVRELLLGNPARLWDE